MADELLDYPKLVENAMRGVVRAALAEVAEHGLPGDHHFFISFQTTAPGVDIASVLRAQYPDEMTIVLQHKFWDLTVDDDAFSVTLSFGGAQQTLYVPFEAVTGFVDPSVNFGFKFDEEEVPETSETEAAAEPDAESDAADTPADETGQVLTLDSFRKK